LALARPRTIAVMAIAILLMGALYIVQMAKDIFPAINVPVVAVIWTYNGLAPIEMDRRVIRISSAFLTTTVNNIEHVETQSLSGTGIIKVYFHPDTEISEALAEISTTSQAVLRQMPPGISPPSIIQYDASDVPIMELVMSSDTESITQIVDISNTVIFPQLVTIRGASFSPTQGGTQRIVSVDLDQSKMIARGVTAQDLTTAIGSQNLILPAGDAKMGQTDYFVRLNNSPNAVQDFNSLPIKMVNGATVYVRDVAQVRNGEPPEISIVRVNGKPAVLLTLLKNGGASTLDVVQRLNEKLPLIRSLLPKDVKLDMLLDQSIFVRAAISGVVREALIATALTGLMILLFLGSWRSTIIVAVSIPLSILTSIVVLGALGQTLNTLTLGGLALAVGMLVDDATVAVENTTRNLSEGLPLRPAILVSAEEVALPALTATLSICIVFAPVIFLAGVARSLFMPLAMAVVFAMIPSYVLSRTLVNTMMDAMLHKELDLYSPQGTGSGAVSPSKRSIVWRVHEHFERHFEAVRDMYRHLLSWTLRNRAVSGFILVGFFVGSMVLLPYIGQDFFPKVDAGQIRLHVRVAPGTRIEETQTKFSAIEQTIKQEIPANELELMLDNIGLISGEAYVRGNSGTLGNADGEIDISLTEKHSSTWGYQDRLRKVLTKQYPDCTFYFQPADMSTQVLDFGTSAPIDVQITGNFPDVATNYANAQAILAKARQVPGVVDAYIYQVQNAPELMVNVNRQRAIQMGLMQADVANNVLISLASSILLAPSYYLDPDTGFEYTVAAQTPQYKIDSVDQLLSTPVSSVTSTSAQTTPTLLNNLATISRDTTPEVFSTQNLLPVFDVYCSVENRDLGGATAGVKEIVKQAQKHLPRGTQITVSGQAETMSTSFLALGAGLFFAIVLIYLLLVVNFESWVDPAIILMASPGALSGVLWGLFVTRSTFNVPSLMGTIMSIGVATANSILLVTFANESRQDGKDAIQAALEAGFTRFRPVIMTALAMILGMLPMALGLGEGGEQNAPLGRAVIGGLTVATCTTLFFVPIMYTLLRRRQPAAPLDMDAPISPSPELDEGGATGMTGATPLGSE
jgi:multidrug efflux pump subunit AcrB